MDSDYSLYLNKLKFDPKKIAASVLSYIGNFRLTLLLVLGIIVYGIFGYLNLPRRINPEIKIPIIFVSTVLPGANPNDTEDLLTTPIEKAIAGIKNVKQVSSSSQENFSSISIEFDSHIDPDKAKQDVQAKIDSIDLPDDAQSPNVVALDFEDVPVWQFSLTTPSDTATLFRLSHEIKEKLEDVSTIKTVKISGLETQEIQITLNQAKLNQYGINPLLLSQVIGEELSSYPAGLVTSTNTNYQVAIDARIKDVEDIRKTKLKYQGQIYQLSDLASLSIRSSPNQTKTLFLKPGNDNIQPAVTFSVFKVSGVNIDVSARDAKKIVNKIIDEQNTHFEILTITDFDENIRNQFNELFTDFTASVILVFGTLLLFLGIKQALIASFVLPLSFLFTFGFMQSLGVTLSFISIFSLLLAQGMIVDDAIVIISAMTDYYKTGKFSPIQVGGLVWKDYIVPILTSNLTNVWSFLPLLLATGIIGEFIRTIPIVVITALVGSTAIALLVTIPLMVIILKPTVPERIIVFSRILGLISITAALLIMSRNNPLQIPIIFIFVTLVLIFIITRKKLVSKLSNYYQKHRPKIGLYSFIKRIGQNGALSLKRPITIYKKILNRSLSTNRTRRKVIIAVIIFSLFSYILVPLGLVKNEFFPKTDEDILYVSIELPVGTSLKTTTNETYELIKKIAQCPELDYVVARVGSQVEERSIEAENFAQSNKIAFSLKLLPADERKFSSIDIASKIRENYENYQNGKLFVIERTGGPPSGADLQIKFLGPNLNTLDHLADTTMGYLNTLPGVTNVDKSIKPGVSKLTFIPDMQKINDSGLSLSQVGLSLRTFTNGLPIDTIRINEKDYDIIFRNKSTNQTPEALTSLKVTNKQNISYDLSSLGHFMLQANPTKITHEDEKRSISITASVEKGYNIPQLGQGLETYVDNELTLPAGFSWKSGGINDENQKSVNSIFQYMIIAALLIAATMVIQLKSFRKAIIVMMVIPLAISGIFIMFGLTGTPLSFPSLIGVLALFGIVVKNSILIVDKIDQNVKINLPFKEAVVDGATSRLEPIIFSSATNIIGLIPITLSDPLWRGLGGAIIAGLTFSGTITLLFIPVLFYSWFAPQKLK